MTDHPDHPPPAVARAGRSARLRLAPLLLLAALGACRTAKLPPPAADAPPEAVSTLDSAAPPDSAAASVLLPGNYLSPLTRLQRIEGKTTHLHVDEVRYRAEDARLFQCSYTFGVLDAKDPANISYQAEGLKHTVPDDKRTPGCIHLAWDGDIVYTTHRGNISNPAFLSGWDIGKTDPADASGKKMLPEQLPVLQEPGVSYEGVDVADGTIYVAIAGQGLGVYQRDPATNLIARVGSLGDIGSTWGIRVKGTLAVLTDLGGDLVTVDVSDPTAPKLLGKLAIGGVPRGLAVDGTTAYVAAGSGGLVLADLTDPAAPKLLGQAPTPGTAIRVDYAKGHAFVAAWNDARAYDVSDPANPRLVGATRLTQQATYGADAGDVEVGRPPVTARTLGIAAFEDFVFVGNWWVLYSYRLHPDRQAPNVLIPEDTNTIDFGPVAAGESKTVPLEITNQGTAPLNLFNNWVDGQAFTVTPKQVQVAPGDKTTLQISYSPVADADADASGKPAPQGTADPQAATAAEAAGEWSTLHIWSDDPDYPVRTAFVTANRPGLGIGKPLPETKVALLDGGEWSTAAGQDKVLLLAYFATF